MLLELFLIDGAVKLHILHRKIAGRKPPALGDPSHKVRQGGKGSVWDGTVITLGSKATNNPPQERGVQGGGATLKGHRATDTRWTDTGQTPDGQ